jgi:hypothetical protein
MGKCDYGLEYVLSFAYISLIAEIQGKHDLKNRLSLSLFFTAFPRVMARFYIPVISVILLILVDFFAYIPTIRKSYFAPHQETLMAYITGTLALVTSLYTFESWTFVTY